MINTLSILIPCYNGLCVELVRTLQEQAELIKKKDNKFRYEIIVGDDGSTDNSVIEKNKEINNISNCLYIIRGFNSGRAAIRNFLAKTAKYEWLLFIDCGRTVHNTEFLKTYINLHDISVVYGGYVISGNDEKLKHNLRYIYEKKYKNNNIASERMKACYKHFNTCNFIVKRSIMLNFPFDERIRKYGYEDVLWGKTLYNNNIKITHIDNPLFTEEFDDNKSFVAKTEEGMNTLVNFYNDLNGYSNVIDLVERFKRLHLLSLITLYYKTSRNIIKKNLIGNKPNIFLFNIYKLGTFCYIRKYRQTTL